MFEKFDIYTYQDGELINFADINTPSINKFENKLKRQHFNISLLDTDIKKVSIKSRYGWTLGRFGICKHEYYNIYILTDLISGISITVTEFKSLIDTKNKIKKFLELINNSEYSNINFTYDFKDDKDSYDKFVSEFYKFLNELCRTVYNLIED